MKYRIVKFTRTDELYPSKKEVWYVVEPSNCVFRFLFMTMTIDSFNSLKTAKKFKALKEAGYSTTITEKVLDENKRQR